MAYSLKDRTVFSFSFFSLFMYFILFFKILFIFRERGKGGERDGNINVWLPLTHPPPTEDLTWPATQACALTGKQTSDPLIPRLAT